MHQEKEIFFKLLSTTVIRVYVFFKIRRYLKILEPVVIAQFCVGSIGLVFGNSDKVKVCLSGAAELQRDE